MSSRYNILVVEDEPLIAEDIQGYLEESGFGVTGIANSGAMALEILSKTKTDALLLDINLGSAPDGIELAGIIRQKYQLPFVFLTSHADKSTLERAKLTFPAGYLLKPFDGSDLMTSLEIALFNHFNLQQSLKQEFTQEEFNAKLPNSLSDREYELLLLLKTGKTNKQIADDLFISVNTVKTHLQHLFEKLDVRNRTQAIFRIRELMEA
jgi:DNA-binding NarL/FixJ family response regulator